MTENIDGKIIFAQVGKIPATGEKYGIITVKTPEDKKVELKINESTEYKSLKTGTKVTVTFEDSDESEIPIATEVKIN
ncbi:MAG: hypothetical protein ACFFBJ_00850 [Promethearchaeota archaeon]